MLLTCVKNNNAPENVFMARPLCGPLACKNRFDLFLGQRSYKETKPGFSFWATVTSNGSPYALGPLSSLSVTLVCCGQTLGWIETPLGTEVGLGPSHIVFYPAFPRKGHSSSPHFSAHVCCGQRAGWIRIPLGTELDLGQ